MDEESDIFYGLDILKANFAVKACYLLMNAGIRREMIMPIGKRFDFDYAALDMAVTQMSGMSGISAENFLLNY